METWTQWKLQRGTEEEMSASTSRAICVQGDALKRVEHSLLVLAALRNAGWHPEENRCLCHQLSLPESIAAGSERTVRI